MRRDRCEYAHELPVVPVRMRKCHDHSGNEQLDAIQGVNTQRSRLVAKIGSLFVPAARSNPLLGVVPLAAVGIVLHMTAEALRRPLAVAGRTLKPFVIRIVRLAHCRFDDMAIDTANVDRIALVYGIACIAHQVRAFMALGAGHA